MFGPLLDYFTGRSSAWKSVQNAAMVVFDPRLRDTNGRAKVSLHQNIYEADFEYGTQPLRWENFTRGTGVISHIPGLGGVQMQISAVGDITIRQSRSYQRYQPGKSMYMASNVNFGGPVSGQVQRVGIFDDANGVFFEQAAATTTNPSGMFVVIRSDAQGAAGGMPVDTRIPLDAWNGDKQVINAINWTRVQMVWLEYAWYGAGALRWGVLINGEPIILHQVGTGNNSGTSDPLAIGTGMGLSTGTPTVAPWSRTGNLPVRYEQRNVTAATTTTFRHYGVSVLVDGRVDTQRGFTYSYGMSPTVPRRTAPIGSVRFPVMSFRMRTMGQVSQDNNATNGAVTSGTTTTLVASAAPFVASAFVGRMLYYNPVIGTSVSSATMQTATITASFVTTGTTLTVTAVTGTIYLGQTLTGGSAAANTVVIGQLTGTTGGIGTYVVNTSNTAGNTATGTSGAVCRIVFSAAHNLNSQDKVTLSNFTTAINGVYPVLAAVNATTIDVGIGAVNPGAITVGSGVVTGQYTARISANTTTTLTFQDVVTGLALANPPTAGCAYQIGLINRGQLLPQQLLVSADQVCVVELIAGTPTARVGLNGASFQPASSFGAVYSFAERDVSATALTGGEVVYAFTSPAGGSGLLQLDLSTLFPVLTNIKGDSPDILTVAVTVAPTASTAPQIGVNAVCQEAMS